MSLRLEPWLLLSCLSLACSATDPGTSDAADTSESSTGDGDGDGDDPVGDGDGDDPAGDGDGDGGSTGDGDGDPVGDGDGDPSGDGDGDGEEPMQCNGHAKLCDRPFDEVVFASTHNSHSALDDGYTLFNANHQSGIAEQLEAGVRGMLIDTYYDDGDPQRIILCHGPCNLGSTSHIEVLELFLDFLNDNPYDVLTLIYQDGVSAEDLAFEYEDSGLIDLVYTHPEGGEWPTLGELIANDTRLIVTVENGGPPPAWHHNIWEQGWDTPYGPSDPDDLSCELNRGSPENDLFLVNHWVNNLLGLPSAEQAEVVNQYDFLLARAQACAQLWDHAPNFLTVDFWERGDLFAVVDTLNGVD